MRRRDSASLRSITATSVVRVSLARRRMLGWVLVPATQLLVPAIAFANVPRIASTRLWPAQEYTRLILESPAPVPHQMLVLKDPNRVVLDLDGVKLSPELMELPLRVQASDPYIASIRFGTRAPTTLRLVIDLRGEVRPQLFALEPVAEFGHRVVLDLYPMTPPDPLLALIEETEKRESKLAATRAAEKLAEPRPERAPEKKPPPPRIEPRRAITIALDPGHGGEDPGAIGPRGTYEKTVVLAIAKKLKRLIDAEPGMRSMLTRDDDYYVPLAARVQKARQVQADLFISIHADAFTMPSARGSSVFALSEHGATSAAAKWLAQKENAADLIGGVNLGVREPTLARTLLAMSQTAQISDSLKVGRSVLDGIGTINPLHKASVEQAGFAVLKAPDIPSILVETAFISNPDEEMKLRNDKQQAKFAESIYGGVRRYFATNPPLARA